MFFTDSAFFIFLPTVVVLYWLLPHKAQNILLLGASYLFYGFVHPWISFIMIGVSLTAYSAGRLIEFLPSHRKVILIGACVLCLGVLGWFKYAVFIFNILKDLSPAIQGSLKIFLPAGISFYTFQALAYVVDVYRGHIPAEKNLPRFVLFISFFPQLVAGPIERAQNLLRQINLPREWSKDRFISGIDLLLIGFVKKVVIADNVAVYVNMIFDLRSPSTLMILVGALGFSIQVLADFSAYTDIARGCGKLLGFELIENFKNPYLSKSPAEFWTRWHISLSNCIRDYVYYPLGGSRGSEWMWIRNILITWILCGAWHGAGWNFVLWGAYWALLIIAYRYVTLLPNHKALDWFRTCWFFTLFVFGLIIFRTESIGYVPQYFSGRSLELITRQLPETFAVFLVCIFYALPLLVGVVMQDRVRRWCSGHTGAILVRMCGYSTALFLLTVFASESGQDFYYFQF